MGKTKSRAKKSTENERQRRTGKGKDSSIESVLYFSLPFFTFLYPSFHGITRSKVKYHLAYFFSHDRMDCKLYTSRKGKPWDEVEFPLKPAREV